MSTIIMLLNQIKEEKIVLPGIQREFVWSPDKISSLLDSILRGYPTGIVLLWETYRDLQYRRFIRDYSPGQMLTYADNPEGRALRIVLDGQQRLQSLYLALYGTYEGKALWFDALSGDPDQEDLSEERYVFQFLKPEEASADKTRHWIRVADLYAMGDVERLAVVSSIATSRQLDDGHRDRLHLNLARFDSSLTKDESVLRETTIDENLPAISPSRKTEADVLEIFVRINRQGTPLTRSDLIFSMLKLNWRESAEALPLFLHRINEGNAFAIDTDFVIRALFAVSDLGTKLDLDLLRRRDRVALMQANFEECCHAIEAAVDFVSQKCHCQSSEVLGSPYFLLPIVYYLYHAPNHEVPFSEEAKLRKAVQLLGLARPFSRYGEGRTGAYIRDLLKPQVLKGDLAFPLEATLERIRYWERIRTTEDLLNANVMMTLHLLQGHSGANVRYHRNAPEVDHIFPHSQLLKRGHAHEDVNHVGNYWILAQGKNRNKSDTDPGKFFRNVPDEILEDACIERDLLTYSRYKRFLAMRMSCIEERILKRIRLTSNELNTLLAPATVEGQEE